jgi:hypothetical protein
MMCRMDTTTHPTAAELADAAYLRRLAAERKASGRPMEVRSGVPDPWSNDPDRTTRQFVASVPPGGQR